MNQQNQFGNLFATPKRVKKNASYFRAQARRSLSGHWGGAVFVAFVAFMLGATVMGGINVDVSTFLIGSQSTPMLMAIVVGTVAAFLIFVSAPIKVGYQKAMLRLLDDGEEPTANTLFAYFRGCYWKSVWLNALYLSITALPSVAMYALAGSLMNGAVVDATRNVVDEAGNTVAQLEVDSAFLTVFAIVLALCAVAIVWSCVLSYLYRYCFTVLAEYPEVGAIEALRMARNMMRGRKWKLFCLDVSFIGWLLVGLYTVGLGLLYAVPYREMAFVTFYDEAANRSSAKEVEFPSLDFNDYTE